MQSLIPLMCAIYRSPSGPNHSLGLLDPAPWMRKPSTLAHELSWPLICMTGLLPGWGQCRSQLRGQISASIRRGAWLPSCSAFPASVRSMGLPWKTTREIISLSAILVRSFVWRDQTGGKAYSSATLWRVGVPSVDVTQQLGPQHISQALLSGPRLYSTIRSTPI